MSDDKLIAPKKVDGFSSESPVRAFTDFKVQGRYAIGKGFRPSLAHLTAYLDAMDQKEGWRMVQLLLPDNDAGDPTIIFRKEGYPPLSMPDGFEFDPRQAATAADPNVGDRMELDGFGEPALPLPPSHPAFKPGVAFGTHERVAGRTADLPRHMLAAIAATDMADDPVNPRHYNGTACAEIGELLSANSYQVLKYNWRLGEKDDPCIELGKALWYLDREIKLGYSGARTKALPVDSWFADRLDHTNESLSFVAWSLIDWTRGSRLPVLSKLRLHLESKRTTLECGSGLAI